MIQNKLYSITLAYNGGFQNIMHHILGALKLELTIFGILFHFCYFGICLSAYIGLDYYTTNNDRVGAINGWTNLSQNQSPYILKILIRFWKLQLVYIDFLHYFSMSLCLIYNFSFFKHVNKNIIKHFFLQYDMNL